MILKVIFAQRRCKYPGEYGPETFACMTEYEHDENPDYLEKQLEEAKSSGHDFTSVKLIDLKVDERALVDILNDVYAPLQAEIKQ